MLKSYLFYFLLGSFVVCAPAFSADVEIDGNLEQATALADRDDFIGAAEKMERVIEQYVEVTGIREGSEYSASSKTLRHYQGYLRLLCYFYIQQGDYSRARKTLDTLFTSEAKWGDLERAKMLSRDRLMQWWLLQLLGEKAEAKRVLLALKEASERRGEICFTSYARYLLDEIDVQLFVTSSRGLTTRCSGPGKSSEALVHFWIGQKHLLNGKPAEAQKHLTQFLNKSDSGDVLERGIVFKQLGLSPSDRAALIPKRSSDNKGCMCAISSQ